MQLPEGFVQMMHETLGDSAEAFLEAMERPPVVSVRLNSRKPSGAFDGCREVPWCRTGRYLEERPVFTLDPLLHAGAYYVQDASSMIHREVVARLLAASGWDRPVSALDMCAAPGGKTTAMIDALPDGSRVVANEYEPRRASALRENLAKWGYPGATVTNRDSEWFARTGQQFDIVAVDAPCSGEGMMRKEPAAVAQWSPELIERCASLQRVILDNAAKTVMPGGYLIYSTCTFNTTENEDNAAYIRDVLGFEPVDMEFPREWGIGRGIGTDLPVYRFMPHLTEGEGLFLAVFRKPGRDDAEYLAPAAKGRALPKGKVAADSVPPIEEILATDFDRTKYPLAEVDLETARRYLRREAVVLGADIPRGLVVITYKGLPLGPAKNIGNRANNLYPKGWRILMR